MGGEEWRVELGECMVEIETAIASLLKLNHVAYLIPLLSPEVT